MINDYYHSQEFINDMTAAFMQQIERWGEVLFEIYKEEGIEILCEKISSIEFDSVTIPETKFQIKINTVIPLKEYIISNKNSPLTDADKVYLASYNV